MSNVHLIDHPLVQHKLTLMRRKDTSTNSFRRLLNELASLMAYEVTRDMATQEVEIETPLEKMKARVIDGKKLVFVSILRAGTGILDGMLSVVPGARVAEIDDSLADTAAFCEAYDVAPEASANCVVVFGRRGEDSVHAAVLVLATDKADVNKTVRKELGMRKMSFADQPTAEALRTRDRYIAKLRELGGRGRPEGWTFLTAVGADDDRQIHRVADAVGFGYRYIATQREYAHPAVTIALAPSGQVMRYVHGVTPEPGELDQTIVRAGVGETSSAAGFLAACLHWDAARNSHRWGGQVMKFAALLFLAVGGIALGVLVARNRRGPGVNPS